MVPDSFHAGAIYFFLACNTNENFSYVDSIASDFMSSLFSFTNFLEDETYKRKTIFTFITLEGRDGKMGRA